MQSSNPVFNRSAGFNGRGGQGYGQTATWNPPPTDSYGIPDQGSLGYGTSDRMTIDSVVQKSGITLAVAVIAAAATWWLTGDLAGPGSTQTLGTLYVAVLVGSLGAFALSMVNSFKRVVSPPLVLAFAALEGVFLGAISKIFEAQYPGIVVHAVIGTMLAFAGTLATYKILDIKVGDRFRKGVTAAMFGFVGLMLLNFVLSFFGADFGLAGFGAIGLIASIVGLVLGVLMLVLDFDFVERGVAAGLPEREAWRAAFGLTVTLVWIYVNLLRILAILRGD